MKTKLKLPSGKEIEVLVLSGKDREEWIMYEDIVSAKKHDRRIEELQEIVMNKETSDDEAEKAQDEFRALLKSRLDDTYKKISRFSGISEEELREMELQDCDFVRDSILEKINGKKA